MDFLTNQFFHEPKFPYKSTPAPERRAFQPEFQYNNTPAPVGRAFQPEFQYKNTPAPVRRPYQRELLKKTAPEWNAFQPEFQYKNTPAPVRRPYQRKLLKKTAPEWKAFQPEFQYKNTPAPVTRAYQPKFQYKETPAPVRRPFESELPYKAASAPERRAFQPEFQYNAAAMPDLRRSRKVRQIPVRSAGEDETRPASALMIQKVFRGHLVRKAVRKLLGIKREVEAIEARFSKTEELDLFRQKDGKERLKLNESLMSLLLKLDAVKGYGDSGIRIFRKTVIGKAIALQEKLDSLENDEKKSEELKPTCFDEINEETAAVGGGWMAKVVEQNEKMVKMMMELFEMNEAQEKMIRSLNHRLEQLENVFICDMMDQIKRRNEKHIPLNFDQPASLNPVY